MELVYTTNDIEAANKLSARLTASSISNYVAGEQMANYSFTRNPASIAVWIHNAEDFDRAYKLMIKIGYAFPPSDKPRPNLKHNRILVVILVTVFILIMGVAIVGVP